MKFKRENKNNKKTEQNENDIEIVMGDNSNLNISDVGDYVNDLKPKTHEDKKKKVVIPKTKKN